MGYYQVDSPKNDVKDIVEIQFVNGDYCLEQTKIPIKYKTKIRLECDYTETEVKH